MLHGIQKVAGEIEPDRVHWLNGGGRQETSRRAIVSFLKRQPAIRRLLVSAVSDHSAMGAVQALKASRLRDSSVVVGHDGDPEAIREIAEGDSPYLGTVAFSLSDTAGPWWSCCSAFSAERLWTRPTT